MFMIKLEIRARLRVGVRAGVGVKQAGQSGAFRRRPHTCGAQHPQQLEHILLGNGPCGALHHGRGSSSRDGRGQGACEVLHVGEQALLHWEAGWARESHEHNAV